MQVIKGLKYSKDHEWARVEGNRVTLGITDYAQHSLGDIVFVELPVVGKKLSHGDVMGVVESVKAASDIYTPVSGTVIEINVSLSDSPEKINTDPYGSWIAILELADPAELEAMLDADAYEGFCREEA
jgi:glycine cleavage system H protein